MTARKPLVLIDGVISQLPEGDTLDVPGSDNDRLLSIYNGQFGGAAIEKGAQGAAFHADAQALFPALTTAVAAAPRDPTFVPTAWPSGEMPAGSPVAASGTAAGVQLVAGVGNSIQMTTGSTAAGYSVCRFMQSRDLVVPFKQLTAVRVTADLSIQTLSVAAQRFSAMVAAYLPGGLSLEVSHTDTRNGGAFTLSWELMKSAEDSDFGELSTGVVPTVGVTYTIDIEATFNASAGSIVVRIRNNTTNAETTVTAPTPAIVYEVDVPAYWEANIFKSVGTSARTLRLNRARGYVRHA